MPNLPEDMKVQIYASKPNGQVERYLVAPAEMDETLALLELSDEILFMEVPFFMVPGDPAPFIPPTASPVLGRIVGTTAAAIVLPTFADGTPTAFRVLATPLANDTLNIYVPLLMNHLRRVIA